MKGMAVVAEYIVFIGVVLILVLSLYLVVSMEIVPGLEQNERIREALIAYSTVSNINILSTTQSGEIREKLPEKYTFKIVDEEGERFLEFGDKRYLIMGNVKPGAITTDELILCKRPDKDYVEVGRC